MTIELRSERIGDEEAIDVVNCRAFRSMDEANIVRLMRMYSPAFDRRYSVTAWDGAEMVGHALFTPARIRLMGETITAIALGPIAVVPERQKQGIGGLLIRFGHELGKREGSSLAFLYGHPSYYPRYGYRACYGFGKVTIGVDRLSKPVREFDRLPVREADVPWLTDRWAAEWADVDFGWLWGDSLGEWAIPCMNAVMWWTRDGHRAAYTLHAHRHPKLMLAANPELARDVIATLKPKTLELHPAGWLARHVLDSAWATAEAKPSQAAMACELEDGVLQPYLDALASGSRQPGFTMFPLPFLAC